PIPVDKGLLSLCFPHVSWDAHLSSLERSRHIGRDATGWLSVPKSVERSLLGNAFASERASLERRWLEALQRHEADPTAAVAIAMLYVRQGRLADAASSLSERAASIESSTMASLYLLILQPIVAKALSRLKPQLRLRVLNAVGMLLVSVGRYDEALTIFHR